MIEMNEEEAVEVEKRKRERMRMRMRMRKVIGKVIKNKNEIDQDRKEKIMY